MRAIELKIKQQYFNDILNNEKTFELRKDDKHYNVGDIIHFNIVDNKEDENTKLFIITYVFKKC